MTFRDLKLKGVSATCSMESRRSSSGRVYITTTLPYVNAPPHIGFAAEIVRADITARFRRMRGEEVFFNTGTDEHGLKVYRRALELGIEPQRYVDEMADKFLALRESLGLSEDLHFIRTSDSKHKLSAQEFWRRCDSAGYIEKKLYRIKYCIGCELEKTDSELDGGRCPLHPREQIELIEEENYFFKFSAFREKLLSFYEASPNFIVPRFRYPEIEKFVEGGLEDFSISRLKVKLPWGVTVPDDPDHVLYVWFDALVSYLSTLGWPKDEENFSRWWRDGGEMVQFCGKDNIRQQGAMWQAMLMAAGLPNSTTIIINGFITSGGQKMSKTLGNVIDPLHLVSEYGTDALRYFISRELNIFEDSDFTMERFKLAYNANLADGLGNLVSRVMTMVKNSNLSWNPPSSQIKEVKREFDSLLSQYEFNRACNVVWTLIHESDRRIQKGEPFRKLSSEPDTARREIASLCNDLHTISSLLEPIMPATSKRIAMLIKEGRPPLEPLFPRRN